MPKVNVYLTDSLATAAREAALPISEICQKALADALGSRPPESTDTRNRRSLIVQSIEERRADLERAADALRYGLEPEPAGAVPARLKPIGAAHLAGLIRSTEPAFGRWEAKAQEVAGLAAALAVLDELGGPAPVRALIDRRLNSAREELAQIQLPETMGPPREVLDLLAELTERSHPVPPR